ncbi:MAG: hypothetical protein MUF38_06600 [Anaerolineae bacterium]|nr:hypothetical protein [Anaerolineae bacterium]
MAADLDTLRELFDCTDEDLAANRAGVLSERQRQNYRKDALDACIGSASAVAAAPFGVLIVIGYLNVAVRYGDELGPWVCVVFIAAFALFFITVRAVAGLTAHLIRRFVRDPDCRLCRIMGRWFYRETLVAIERGQVVAVRGMITLESDGEHELVMVDGELLDADVALIDSDDRLWELLEDGGGRYALYVVPVVCWIASVEPLAAD